MAIAQIGPTGYGGQEGPTYGILWKDFPYMEKRSGYSGPFNSKREAETRALEIMVAFVPLEEHKFEDIATVNP